MPTRTLPPAATLASLRREAVELQRAHRRKDRSARARIAGHHPRRRAPRRPLPLAEARLVIAREYGFPDWAAVERRFAVGKRLSRLAPHPRFAEALAALDAGEVGRLRDILAADKKLLRARTNLEPPYGYFSGATLLHHVAGNPGRDGVRLPANIVDIARLLLDLGADANAMTLGPNGGSTLGLVITSAQASRLAVSGPLIDVLLEHGARLDLHRVVAVVPDWPHLALLDLPLANHAPRAAEKLIELGVTPDVCAAAALGRMDLVREAFDGRGRLRARPRRGGRLMTERDAIGLALLFAYVNRHPEAVELLLEKDGNWNMTGVNNGTALHRAAWSGDLAMVQRLVAKGADVANRDNPFVATPLSWAQHNQQALIVAWLRAHCAIDLHDAAGFGLREHVVARLREDPASVDRRRDQWDIPDSTPLHWASWPALEDIGGTRPKDPGGCEELLTLLLDHGADPNLIAGNGLTALDIALAGKAENLAALLRRRGGKRAGEL